MPAVKIRRDADDFDSDPYASDDFRMYEFKIRRCMRGRSHDWTDCPFAHPGEKARRRDPRRYHYSGNVCAEFRRGACTRGDSCEFSHGVFECWLHPARYRTQPCKDGRNCNRKVCFFAHTPGQLRILPSLGSPRAGAHTCNLISVICSCAFHSCNNSVSASSPITTLIGASQFSPPLSPPPSPGYSPESPFHGIFSYNAILTKFVNSLVAMDISSASAASPSSSNATGSEAFVLSPSSSSVSRDFYEESGASEEDYSVGLMHNNGFPDVEWVKELVM